MAVLAIGLFTAGLGTMIFLRNALDASLDAQVQQLSGTDIAKSVFDITASGDDVDFAPAPTTTIDYSGFFVAVYAADGRMLATTGPRSDNRPELPPTMSALQTGLKGAGPFTLSGTDGAPFRASVTPFQVTGRSAFYTQLVAVPTSSVARTIGTFLGIYSVIAVLTIIAGALVTRWLVTLAFRSLGQVESTAMAIADGDFSQRMTDIESGHTEVGRLKKAINAMLGRVDEAIGERDAAVRQMRRFVGDASHELRTPLVSVRGYAELYRIGAIRTDADTAQAMDRIEKEAIRMGVLVEDLLALTRLDEGREELLLVPVDLRPIAHDAALDVRAADPDRPVSVKDESADAVTEQLPVLHLDDTVPPDGALPGRRRSSLVRVASAAARPILRRRPRPTAGPTDAEPSTEAAPAASRPLVPVVYGEENRIRQVVTNLLANARRYAPEGSPIELTVGTDAAAGTGWIAISDHGDGIPRQIRDQIFQRFWRADTSRARETGGSGLGLSIVASIVESLQGTVAVSDTPGGGATFTIAFPLAADGPDMTAVSPSAPNTDD